MSIETQSDLDRLLAEIAERKANAKPFDVIEHQAILELVEYASKWFDEDGNQIPVIPDPSESDVDYTFYDALNGLHVSHQRSNGCVVLANPWITGNKWVEEAALVAAEEDCSERLIAMAGYHMIDTSRWCMVPLCFIPSSPWDTEPSTPYWINDGGNPFTDEEERLFKQNYGAAAMAAPIVAGAKLAKAPFFESPATRPGEQNAGLIAGHSIWTAGQNVDQVVSLLIKRFNTPAFMRQSYNWALNKAHAIDRGDGAPVPGYKSLEEIGGEHSLAWYEANENGDKTQQPTFSSAGLLK